MAVCESIDEGKVRIEVGGETVENLQVEYNISRDAQDEFAFHHSKRRKGAKNGRLSDEIMPISVQVNKNEPMLMSGGRIYQTFDNCRKLGTLKPAFKSNGTVTAGNASGLNDGSSLLIGNDSALESTICHRWHA